MPLVQSIFNKTMLEMGQEVSNHCKLATPFMIYNVLIFISVLSHPVFSCGLVQHRCH